MKIVVIFLVFILIGFSSCQKHENIEPKAVESEIEMPKWELHLSIEGKEYFAESTSFSHYSNGSHTIGEVIMFSGQTIWVSFRYQYDCKEVFMRGYINGTSFIVNNPDCDLVHNYKNSDAPLQYSLNYCHGKSNVPLKIRISR